MKRLPLNVQTFASIIEEQRIYVDKTSLIREMIDTGKYLFCSRPRRFGKSLLVSTLKEIFTGNQQLFQGLWIYDQIDWTPHPVIHLDLSRISYDDDAVLKQSLMDFLSLTAQKLGITVTTTFPKDRFFELLSQLHEATQQKVVVLIDEYDKPIIDHIENLEKAVKNREVLREFYGVLKSADEYVRFVFLTGVSKFSRVSIFSGLNNLLDITLSPGFATLLGYTQAELELYFDEHIQQICQKRGLSQAQLLEDIRTWYNGYSWNGHDRVYNPVSILNFLIQGQLGNYWFATGTPTFLVKLITGAKLDVTELEQKQVSELLFDSYDIERMDIPALLFQTGYLTIKRVVQGYMSVSYILDYPNREVRDAFLSYLMEGFTGYNRGEVPISVQKLRRCLQAEDMDGFMTIIRALFAKIPYTLHLPQEAYYHSLFYMILALMGVDIDLEVLTDKGRIDGVLALSDKVYLLEFKYGEAGTDLNRLTTAALRQIREKRYAERYLRKSRKVLFLGVGFADKEIGYQLEAEAENQAEEVKL